MLPAITLHHPNDPSAPTKEEVEKLAATAWQTPDVRVFLNEVVSAEEFIRSAPWIIASAGRSKQEALKALKNGWTGVSAAHRLPKGYMYVVFQIFKSGSTPKERTKESARGVELLRQMDRLDILYGYLDLRDRKQKKGWKIIKTDWQDIMSSA